MISALGKPSVTPPDTNYGTETYRELPSAGSELDEFKPTGITRTREYVIQKSQKEGGHENTIMAPTW
jgi:hypothetical protein